MDFLVLTEHLPKLLFAEEGGGLVQQELSFIVLLFIAAMVAIVVRRIRLPYTVALVLVGLVLSFFPNFLGFTVSSDLILAILVPPLVFEATLHIPWRKLKKDLLPVLLLAVGGTLATSASVAPTSGHTYVLINNDLEESVRTVRAILTAERVRRKRQPALTEFVQQFRAAR